MKKIKFYLKKIYNLCRAMYILPYSIVELYETIQEAKRMHATNPERYYVLASSPTSLIVTSRPFQKKRRPMSVVKNATNGRSKVATGDTMYNDCYYFTPSRTGKIPKDYYAILKAKFKMYIYHQLTYIRTGLR